MTRAEKDLLVKDLCARFPHGVICQLSNKGAAVLITEKLGLGGLEHFIAGSMCVKPFLRPMSSMTEEEYAEYNEFEFISASHFAHAKESAELNDWLNAHHLDYRRLIEKGLALEAPKDMYKIK